MSSEKAESELWVPVYGFLGLYEISNFGRIKSVRREVLTSDGKCRTYGSVLLKLATRCADGCTRVVLSHSGVPKSFSVASLVLKSFDAEYDGKQRIMRIDGDLNNNRLDNLTYRK